MDAMLTIGEVARRAGLRTSAIRYYESRGVLPEPKRAGGQRRYTAETVRRLHVIGVAQRAGFTLDETRVLLATGDDGQPAYEQIRELAQRKLPEVDALIRPRSGDARLAEDRHRLQLPVLDVCALFDADALEPPAGAAAALSITHVG
jgi:MerR family transcriptional regulator, redox-sensitive transcriptional activator SoxR